MAHFAELDNTNTVIRVIVVNNSNILDEFGKENENIGIQFLKNIFGENTKWVQTSYNDNFRLRMAGIGFKYDETYDAFIEPKPYNSWNFNTTYLYWEPPIPYPNDGNNYIWNETTLSWDLSI